MNEYNFCPRCGKALQNRFLHGRNRPVCPACGYVVYLDPKVGAGVVVEVDGRVVLVRRGMEPMRGHWSLPSGYVERDETPDATAARETLEETGLQVGVDNLLNVYSFEHQGSGGRGVLVLYSAHVIGGELRAGDDADEVSTFAPDELPSDIAFESHRQALREWRRAKAIVYRLATAEEAGTVAGINLRFRSEIGTAYPPAEPGEGALFVAVDRSEVVGYAYLALRPSRNTANLDQIFVLPSHRRWGVATHLMNAAVGLAKEKRLRAVLARVQAASPALIFYIKAGFGVVGFAHDYEVAAEVEPGPSLCLAYPLSE